MNGRENISSGLSSSAHEIAGAADGSPAEYIPRPKRIACILCRRRKLKCDGGRPSCATCSRLGHTCAYDEVRKKSGPKRGYVKQLEARLAQVETLLKTQDSGDKREDQAQNVSETIDPTSSFNPTETPTTTQASSMPDISMEANMLDATLGLMGDPLFDINNDFSWEMISLGVEEPLPEPDIMNELHDIYFRKIHVNIPVIHRARFYAQLNLSPHMKPPICLRYAMWTNAASVTPKYASVVSHFYARARKYAEADEMKGFGEQTVSVAHAQCWVIIAMYEFKTMMFPRAWQSVGRATRLCQMMGLHRQDGQGLDVKQCIPPPRDWTEREERRRTFWAAFCNDRYASVGTGWPFTIDEKDITSFLPASEEAFQAGRAEETPRLDDALDSRASDGVISSFAGVCLIAAMFGRNLHHLHRPDADDNDEDLNSEFWKRHRTLDNTLLTTVLSFPATLKLPQGLSNPNTVFCNLMIHTAAICLHQAAIFKADKNRSGTQVSSESKRRCIIAAEQITNIMRMITTLDLTLMNPFMCFSIYVACRVFIQYLKTVPNDGQARSSLRFLLTAMQTLDGISPLSNSFLAQLEVELEGGNLTGFRVKVNNDVMSPEMARMKLQNKTECSPLVSISEEQSKDPFTQPRPLMESQVRAAGTYGTTRHPRNSTSSTMPSLSHQSSSSAEVQFGRGPLSNLSVAQEFSLSSGGFQDVNTQLSSDHPTPSTLSHKDSSNTSSYSPNTDCIGGKQPQGSNGFEETFWNSQVTNMPSGLTASDPTGTTWPQVDGNQWGQSLDGVGWNGWNDAGGPI